MSTVKELQFALRTIVRYPWTHGSGAFIIAIAVATVLSTLSIMDEMLWAPLPGIERPERAAWLYPTRAERGVDHNEDEVTLANALYYREHAQTLDSVAWFNATHRVLLGGEEPEGVAGFAVSADFFRLTGSVPQLGRLIESGDTLEEARPVVVLGDEFWKRRFGGDLGVIGTQLDFDGVLHTVIGVTPERFFAQMGAPPSVWLSHRVTAEMRADRALSVPTLARLKPGADFAAVERELGQLSAAIAEAHPETDQGMSVKAVPLPNVLSRFRPLAFALVFAALFVLGAAGANTANLLLAQTAERTRELAIRQALGAGSWAIVRQWCWQVGVLMVLAIGAGTLLGRWALDGISASMPPHMKMSSYGTPDAAISLRSWLATVAVAAGAIPLIGVVPARQAARIAIGRALRDGGGGALGKAKGRLTRRWLVGLQVTFASALTFGALCGYLGFVQARAEPLGFDATGITELRLPSPEGVDLVQRGEFLEQLVRRWQGDAHGERVAMARSSDPPLSRTYQSQSFFVEGTPKPGPDRMPWGKRNDVGNDYFSLFSIPITAGRAFSAEDARGSRCVVIFSEKLAQSTFRADALPGGAVGRRVHLEAIEHITGAAHGPAEDESMRTCEVVGVAGEVRDLVEGGPGDIYFSASQSVQGGTVLVRGATPAALAALRSEIRRFDPRQVIWARSFEDVVDGAQWGWRILAALFASLAGIGLSLAGIGTYAMLSHSASLRSREFGLRAVLGARPRELAWLVVSENLSIGAGGIVVGVAGVAVGMALIAHYSPGWWAYVASAAFTAALLASSALLSARRVMALDPGLALRRR